MTEDAAKGRGGLRDSSIRTVAVVCPSWVGDVVMCTPVLRMLREQLPDARLVGVARPGLDEVLAGAPWLDDVQVDGMKGLFGPVRVGGLIRKAGADAVLLLPNSMRSAIAARASGARIRIGYERDGRGPLLTHGLRPPRREAPVPTVQYYCDLAAWALDVDSIDLRMELFVTDAQEESAREALEGAAERFVVLNPGGNKPLKRWPPERFARVAERLREEDGLDAAVTGAPSEREIVEAVMKGSRVPIIDLLERGVGLGALKGVIRRASLLITNDTGPRHFAAALGTPVVTLFGPTDHRWTTLRGVVEHVLTAEPFLTEDLVANDAPEFCRVDRIGVGDVLAASRGLLAATEAGVRAAASPPTRMR